MGSGAQFLGPREQRGDTRGCGALVPALYVNSRRKRQANALLEKPLEHLHRIGGVFLRNLDSPSERRQQNEIRFVLCQVVNLRLRSVVKNGVAFAFEPANEALAEEFVGVI